MAIDEDTATKLRDLRILITGGTSGLGRALVHTLRERGARVAFVARTPQRVLTVAQSEQGTLGITDDVTDKEAVHRIALQVLAWRGGLDVLVNNASSLGPVPLAPLADTACEALEAALSTNVIAPFRLTRALLGALTASAREGRGGVVVNISSDAAVNAYAGWGAYGASKAALLHLTRTFDAELQTLGVRFISIDPGDMDTPLHTLAVPGADPATLRRPDAAADDVARAIAGALRDRDRDAVVETATACA